MQVGLFIPCYVDQFYPKVAIATLEVLEAQGCEVIYPVKQTCCGQPLANSGYGNHTHGIETLFRKNFEGCEYIVCPSGSCTLHSKEHILDEGAQIYELTEFLIDVIKTPIISATFPYKVGLHQSCHGLRGLRVAKSSELNIEAFDKPAKLLNQVADIDLITVGQPDECCGFGGTFAIAEEALSIKMGKDRIDDHVEHEVDVITGGDMSCLMHLEGLIKRDGKKIKVMHIAEILNGAEL